MNVRDLRAKYLAFFQSKGHQAYPSGRLIPYDVTGRLDESLLFNGAGMVQFKPYFRGVAEPPSRRLTNAQKCLRTGDIEEVGDTSHLTFFEMLGNFSFGDYFKEEAIAFSWEFLTGAEWLSLDPRRLAFTVFTEDDVAEAAWAKHLQGVGIDAKERVFRLGEETNYWPAGAFSKGPPGPCGPNSEMFYWVSNDVPPPSGPYTVEDYLRDEAAGMWLEIWNDVFIQYEWQGEPQDKGYRKTGMPPLPFASVDTGMGLERTAAVLGGHRSVYDTDGFTAIFARIQELGGPQYGGDQDRALRIVADHLRAATFCIADGILPGNTGRGYVLRRLIRRAVLQGQRKLGFSEPFLAEAATGVMTALGDHYTELNEHRATIQQTLRQEEDQFRRTLAQGSELLARELEGVQGTLPGDVAFRLYDTYGFPLEITRELAQEQGVVVDEDGYEVAMQAAQARSRGASEMDDVYAGVDGATWSHPVTPTEFTGYAATSGTGVILATRPAEGGAWLALDKSPFYAESGGQQADWGTLTLGGQSWPVTDVQKADGVWAHRVQGQVPSEVVGQIATLAVDEARRADITRHHTATHLLHAALRERLGAHVTQAGSLVAPDQLRFDFTHGQALTPEDLRAVEDRVNEHVLSAQPVVIYEDVPLDEARAMGAMALFGEKYADRVRVVQIGGMKPEIASFSRELCGGIHVPNTGAIGQFRIRHEGSAASGIRRITAVCGRAALQMAQADTDSLQAAAHRLKTSPAELLTAIDRTLDTLREERRKREQMAATGAGQDEATATPVAGVTLKRLVMKSGEAEDAKRAADRLVDNAPLAVVVVGIAIEGKVQFVAKIGAEAQAQGAHAGNLVRELAKLTGGGGGGRADFATAGGRDATQLDAAMAAAEGLLQAQLGA